MQLPTTNGEEPKRILRISANTQALNKSEEKLLLNHDLLKLWEVIEPRLKHITASGYCAIDSNEIQGMRSYIQQLNNVDQKADQFRFPMTREGTASLKSLGEINIQRATIVLERLINYLAGLDEILHERL